MRQLCGEVLQQEYSEPLRAHRFFARLNGACIGIGAELRVACEADALQPRAERGEGRKAPLREARRVYEPERADARVVPEQQAQALVGQAGCAPAAELRESAQPPEELGQPGGLDAGAAAQV